MNDVKNAPGLVITNKVNRTTKVKKFIEKNKISNYTIVYLENPPTDFRDLERELKNLENRYLGVEEVKEKPKQDGLRECPFKYRVNANTVLEAYTQEDLNKLKEHWNIKS